MLKQDSIHTEPVSSPITADTVVQKPTRPQTPYQVLRLLPKDATPAQQDSAIQAWFQPGEIHYSDQPDTLHLPGHSVGRNLKEVNIPQYYRESYFSNDSLFHPELDGGRFGMAGDPIPYATKNDNAITSLLLICFVLSLIAFSICKNYLIRQGKNFFYLPKADQMITETSTEIKSQFFFLIQTCLLLALLYFFYTRKYIANSFILTDEYMLVGILFGVILGYFLFKYLVYAMVNQIFFDSKRNGQFFRILLFIQSCEGVLLFPIVVLLTFFDIPAQSVVYYTTFVVILVKILTFYKCFVIFFRQNGVYLQIILYFCALEIVPLFALWSGLSVIVNALKINF
jgi:hypothetical protein